MKTLTILYADEGKILTDGKSFGRAIRIPNDADESKYYEITEAEYEEIKVKEAENEDIH